jgi:two-component system, OmpR family, phosphate regulon sensor histidine kinase PhoR
MPASAIRGQVARLREETGTERPPRESRVLDVIATQSDRLNRRVQEMLAVVGYRVVATRQSRQTFDLGDLAAEVLRRTPARGLPNRIGLQRDAPTPVAADRDRIADVLTSLIDNALQYSPAGGPISIRVSRVGPDAVVAVRDSGVGIRTERQAHVFEPFYESVPSGALGYRGVVALSLYLSKLIIDQHNGRIWFESTPGEGSVFYFRLPLAG